MSNALRPLVLLTILGVASAPGAARAADGVIEINQARAQSGGVTPGDTPGFPVLIAQRGSYRLTGNLTVPNGNTTAIRITAAFVTLDLGGFSIIGPCSGPAFCAPQSGVGIDATGVGQSDLRNGTVQGMGGAGVLVGEGSRVQDLRAIWNGSTGISVGRLSQVRNSTAQSNGDAGIGGAAEQVIAESCTSFANAGSGFAFGRGSIVRGCTSFANGSRGIEFASAVGTELGLFEGNSLRSNGSTSVSGGHATGGNYCDDGLCSIRGARRFYLTQQTVMGSAALFQCALGFHMASFWELYDLAALEYAPALGKTSADAGSGPPNDFGWIRTGSQGSAEVSPANTCSLWTSSSTSGVRATLTTHLNSDPATAVTPWNLASLSCVAPISVWCVED